MYTHSRKDYMQQTLSIDDLDGDPINQLEKWLSEAVNTRISEPHAMTLATVAKNGRPSARMVLLRGLGPEGLRFFTNYLSKKGKDLDENPRCALVFYWPELERQVCIEATAEKLPAAISDEYFASRPLENQLAAWTSQQSQIVANRQVIENQYRENREKFGAEVPRPPHWGGYLAIPDAFEFWQGRKSRLHDRFRYERELDRSWSCNRLAP